MESGNEHGSWTWAGFTGHWRLFEFLLSISFVFAYCTSAVSSWPQSAFQSRIVSCRNSAFRMQAPVTQSVLRGRSRFNYHQSKPQTTMDTFAASHVELLTPLCPACGDLPSTFKQRLQQRSNNDIGEILTRRWRVVNCKLRCQRLRCSFSLSWLKTRPYILA